MLATDAPATTLAPRPAPKTRPALAAAATAAATACTTATALPRVLARWLTGYSPNARHLLGQCLPPAAGGVSARVEGSGGGGGTAPARVTAPEHGGGMLRLRVEAAGSGAVLLPSVAVSEDATVAELKTAIATAPQPTGGTTVDLSAAERQQLFLGHGGEGRLRRDNVPLRAYGIRDGTTVVLLRRNVFKIAVHNSCMLGGRVIAVDVAEEDRLADVKSKVESWMVVRGAGSIPYAYFVHNKQGGLTALPMDATLGECGINGPGHTIFSRPVPS